MSCAGRVRGGIQFSVASLFLCTASHWLPGITGFQVFDLQQSASFSFSCGHPLVSGSLLSCADRVRQGIQFSVASLVCARHHTGFQVSLASSSMTRTSSHAVPFMRASTSEWLPLLSCRSCARAHAVLKGFCCCASSEWFHVLLLFRRVTWMSCLFRFLCGRPPLSGFLLSRAGHVRRGLQFSLASCIFCTSAHWLPGVTGFQVDDLEKHASFRFPDGFQL